MKDLLNDDSNIQYATIESQEKEDYFFREFSFLMNLLIKIQNIYKYCIREYLNVSEK